MAAERESPSAEEVLQQNVDAIRQAYKSVGDGNVEALLDIIDPNVVLRDRPESPDPRTYRGHEGIRQALQSSEESFAGFELQPQEFIAAGDHVIVVLTMRGTGRGSGVTVEDRIAHQWLVRDGRAVACQVYSDPDEAIRAARPNA
jgi:ketosteroid isomerase-like protein